MRKIETDDNFEYKWKEVDEDTLFHHITNVNKPSLLDINSCISGYKEEIGKIEWTWVEVRTGRLLGKISFFFDGTYKFYTLNNKTNKPLKSWLPTRDKYIKRILKCINTK
jgi:hypothetical protein